MCLTGFSLQTPCSAKLQKHLLHKQNFVCRFLIIMMMIGFKEIKRYN